MARRRALRWQYRCPRSDDRQFAEASARTARHPQHADRSCTRRTLQCGSAALPHSAVEWEHLRAREARAADEEASPAHCERSARVKRFYAAWISRNRRSGRDPIATAATTSSVIVPPKITDGTVPRSRAATPDSNAPISFDEPMKI